MLVAVYYVLSSYLSVNLAGIRITLDVLPVAVAAALYGPVNGMIVGFVGNYRLELDGGVLEPTLRGEYHWSLRRSGVANLGYATGMADMPYQVMLSAFDDHRTVGAIGLRWTTENRWIFSLDLERLFSASGDSTAIRVGGTGSF